MKEQYEPIKFETWQELAKYVIDGGEVYYCGDRVIFDEDYAKFSHQFSEHVMDNLYTKKQPTLEELIAIKPRLCWVCNAFGEDKTVIEIVEVRKDGFYSKLEIGWREAQMLTDDES